jgi:hypothetical protein
VTHADTENLRPWRASAVGAVREKLGKSGQPEQAVGSGIVAELELEVGQRAPRCGKGDAHASGSPATLASSPSVEGAHEADGAEAEDPGANSECADVIIVPSRDGAVSHMRFGRVVVVCVIVVRGRRRGGANCWVGVEAVSGGRGGPDLGGYGGAGSGRCVGDSVMVAADGGPNDRCRR